MIITSFFLVLHLKCSLLDGDTDFIAISRHDEVAAWRDYSDGFASSSHATNSSGAMNVLVYRVWQSRLHHSSVIFIDQVHEFKMHLKDMSNRGNVDASSCAASRENNRTETVSKGIQRVRALVK